MPSSDNFRNLTDEHWLWLFANQTIDNDEQLERMCPKCKDEATSTDKCIRCGKVLPNDENRFINPNFDRSKFEKLSNGDTDEPDGEEDVDLDLLRQIEEKDGDLIGNE